MQKSCVKRMYFPTPKKGQKKCPCRGVHGNIPKMTKIPLVCLVASCLHRIWPLFSLFSSQLCVSRAEFPREDWFLGHFLYFILFRWKTPFFWHFSKISTNLQLVHFRNFRTKKLNLGASKQRYQKPRFFEKSCGILRIVFRRLPAVSFRWCIVPFFGNGDVVPKTSVRFMVESGRTPTAGRPVFLYRYFFIFVFHLVQTAFFCTFCTFPDTRAFPTLGTFV